MYAKSDKEKIILLFSRPYFKCYGSVALLLHFTSSEVRFLDLVFLRCAGGPGHKAQGIRATGFKHTTVNFAI